MRYYIDSVFCQRLGFEVKFNQVWITINMKTKFWIYTYIHTMLCE